MNSAAGFIDLLGFPMGIMHLFVVVEYISPPGLGRNIGAGLGWDPGPNATHEQLQWAYFPPQMPPVLFGAQEKGASGTPA